jgi:hypothetical protein
LERVALVSVELERREVAFDPRLFTPRGLIGREKPRVVGGAEDIPALTGLFVERDDEELVGVSRCGLEAVLDRRLAVEHAERERQDGRHNDGDDEEIAADEKGEPSAHALGATPSKPGTCWPVNEC